MIDSEIVVGTGLRMTVARDELASRLAIVARGVSTRTTVLVLGGIQLRAEAGKLHLAATDMEVSLRASLDAIGRRRGHGRRPRPAAARHRALAAGGRGHGRASPRRGGRRRHVRHGELPASHVLVGRFPAAPRRRERGAAHGRPRRSRRDDRPRQPERVTRREPPGADGDPRPVRAEQARDGGDGLVPARCQGDARRGDAAGARGDHSRPVRCRSWRESQPAPTTSSSACTTTTPSSAPKECG